MSLEIIIQEIKALGYILPQDNLSKDTAPAG